jgi:glycosyltransferase involved in cell wall biosynthesis
MTITVIVCTYNRCQTLANALNSAVALRLPATVQWEVLVVDNNSSDDTDAVVEGFRKRHPGRFRYLFEPRPGKSHALNAGIREARGDILAFMDDDVTVEPTWLHNLTGSLHDGEWEGAGGRILPAWTCPPPRWLPMHGRYALAPLAVFDLGQDAGLLTEPPFGTNMAFRKRMFEKHGGFRTDLGPRPASEIRSEDTEFGRRLLAAGERLRYEPSAVVHHPVPEIRIRKEYFLAWWFDKGRASIREFGVLPETTHYVSGIPLYLFRNLATQTLRWTVAFDPRLRFQHKLELWRKAGEIKECHDRSRAIGPSTIQLPKLL